MQEDLEDIANNMKYVTISMENKKLLKNAVKTTYRMCTSHMHHLIRRVFTSFPDYPSTRLRDFQGI